MRQRKAVLISGAILLAGALCGCADRPPYRPSLAEGPPSCTEVYEKDRDAPDQSERIKKDLKSPELSPCWLSWIEKHRNYDLLTVEFDDEGWLAGTDHGASTDETQLSKLMGYLERMSDKEKMPLSVIVYTHGWHHSASPYDGNVVAFRTLLEDAARLETSLCLKKREGDRSSARDFCTDAEKDVESWKRKRRVVGIYIGWRGDSILGPLEDASIWDRKLAAEKVALGSIQELYSRLHDFYIRHGCHSEYSDLSCADVADVRMLTVGHSFGGLITFRALAPRMMASIAETYRSKDSASKAPLHYAYSFGDLTVLINPAFEATRFEPLARAASNRRYVNGEEADSDRTAQLPILVVAQSKGDWATGTSFPIFRFFTTLFESPKGAEREVNLRTVGWSKRYVNHELVDDPQGDVCGQPRAKTDLEGKLTAEARLLDALRANRYRAFDGDIRFCGDMLLKKAVRKAEEGGIVQNAFMPVWVLRADTTIIKDHNDFLNPRLQDFVRQIYYAILREEDEYVAKEILKRRSG